MIIMYFISYVPEAGGQSEQIHTPGSVYTLQEPAQPPPGGLYPPMAGTAPSWRPAPSFNDVNPCVKVRKDDDNSCVKVIKDNDNLCVKVIKDDTKPCVKLIKDDDNPCVKLIKDDDRCDVKPLKCDTLHHLYVTLHPIFIIFTDV